MISKEKDFQEFFPVWNKLTAGQQEQLEHAVRYEHAKKGTIIHNGSLDCVGVLLIHSGQLRAYILSDEGREISLGFPVPCYGVLYFTYYRSDARRIPHASPDI